jgi:predicted 2-oxoglutarate/Fe(II)-dependent dioxygenase YbiX
VTQQLEAPPAPAQTLDGYIRLYNYDLSAEATAVAALEGWTKHQWYNPATQHSHSEAEKELDVRPVDDQPELFKALTDVVVDAVMRYSRELMAHAQVTACSNVRLNRYPVGSVMRPHTDHIHTLFDGQAKGIPALSIVGNLNDGYEGGDLVLCGKPYALKAGQVLVWPSCFLYPHEVLEITAGTRYSFVSWAW